MIDRKNIPIIVECYADNGEYSHFKLIDVETGACLWEESETAHNSDYAKCRKELVEYIDRTNIWVHDDIEAILKKHFA